VKCFPIFQKGDHQWFVFGQDPDRPEYIIDTNQVVIQSGNQALLCDPGGLEVFPAMMAALTEVMPIDNVRHIFLSHQDPDVSSALPVWRQVCPPNLDVYLSWLWQGFVRHFDSEAKMISVPDQGMPIRMGKIELKLLPAHYLHSSGNFNLWDPAARILFSGDIGAAVLPAGLTDNIFVTDFASHIQYLEPFHKRWMGSPPARDAWIAMVRKLPIEMIVPQHGLLFRGDDVKRFLDWFAELELCGGLASIA